MQLDFGLVLIPEWEGKNQQWQENIAREKKMR